MAKRGKFPCDLKKACEAKYLVNVCGLTQTEAAILLHLNQGTVCHVIYGRRFPHAVPIAPVWHLAA